MCLQLSVVKLLSEGNALFFFCVVKTPLLFSFQLVCAAALCLLNVTHDTKNRTTEGERVIDVLRTDVHSHILTVRNTALHKAAPPLSDQQGAD